MAVFLLIVPGFGKLGIFGELCGAMLSCTTCHLLEVFLADVKCILILRLSAIVYYFLRFIYRNISKLSLSLLFIDQVRHIIL